MAKNKKIKVAFPHMGTIYVAWEKALKAIQGTFFKNVYKLLIDKEKGPRLYLFLFAIDPQKYVGLLDFSYPKTEEPAIIHSWDSL